jgi:hypothetical protein
MLYARCGTVSLPYHVAHFTNAGRDWRWNLGDTGNQVATIQRQTGVLRIATPLESFETGFVD